MNVPHFAEEPFEAVQMLVDVEFGVRKEVDKFDLFRFVSFDGREDDLQSTLEKLDLPFDEQIVTDIEVACLGFADVPQPGADGPAAVAQFQLEVRVAVAVR